MQWISDALSVLLVGQLCRASLVLLLASRALAVEKKDFIKYNTGFDQLSSISYQVPISSRSLLQEVSFKQHYTLYGEVKNDTVYLNKGLQQLQTSGTYGLELRSNLTVVGQTKERSVLRIVSSYPDQYLVSRMAVLQFQKIIFSGDIFAEPLVPTFVAEDSVKGQIDFQDIEFQDNFNHCTLQYIEQVVRILHDYSIKQNELLWNLTLLDENNDSRIKGIQLNIKELQMKDYNIFMKNVAYTCFPADQPQGEQQRSEQEQAILLRQIKALQWYKQTLGLTTDFNSECVAKGGLSFLKGADYLGSTNRTEGFDQCDKWSKVADGKQYEDNGTVTPLDTNFCRNPEFDQEDGETGPFCYFKSFSGHVKEVCSIPDCEPIPFGGPIDNLYAVMDQGDEKDSNTLVTIIVIIISCHIFLLSVVLAVYLIHRKFPCFAKSKGDGTARTKGVWHVWHNSASEHNSSAPHAPEHSTPILDYADSKGSNWKLQLTPGALRKINEKDPFGDILLEEMLGLGAYGRVFKAKCKSDTVAVKIFEHSSMGGPKDEHGNQIDTDIDEATMQFCTPVGCRVMDIPSEVRVCVALTHDNIVRTIKCGSRPLVADKTQDQEIKRQKADEAGYTESGQDLVGEILETWIVMEYCDIGNLSDAVQKGYFKRQNAAMEKYYAWQMAMDIASAMEYLHAQDIVHGDLKGANVLLQQCHAKDRMFIAKVSDFGLSKFMSPTKTHLSTRSHGTITHMPPEMINDNTLTKAVDVYSFGVIMWELYTGQVPFQGMNHLQIMYRILEQDGLTNSIPSDTPAPIARLLMDCWDRNRFNRPSFSDIILRLTSLKETFVHGADAKGKGRLYAGGSSALPLVPMRQHASNQSQMTNASSLIPAAQNIHMTGESSNISTTQLNYQTLHDSSASWQQSSTALNLGAFLVPASDYTSGTPPRGSSAGTIMLPPTPQPLAAQLSHSPPPHPPPSNIAHVLNRAKFTKASPDASPGAAVMVRNELFDDGPGGHLNLWNQGAVSREHASEGAVQLRDAVQLRPEYLPLSHGMSMGGHKTAPGVADVRGYLPMVPGYQPVGSVQRSSGSLQQLPGMFPESKPRVGLTDALQNSTPVVAGAGDAGAPATRHSSAGSSGAAQLQGAGEGGVHTVLPGALQHGAQYQPSDMSPSSTNPQRQWRNASSSHTHIPSPDRLESQPYGPMLASPSQSAPETTHPHNLAMGAYSASLSPTSANPQHRTYSRYHARRAVQTSPKPYNASPTDTSPPPIWPTPPTIPTTGPQHKRMRISKNSDTLTPTSPSTPPNPPAPIQTHAHTQSTPSSPVGPLHTTLSRNHSTSPAKSRLPPLPFNPPSPHSPQPLTPSHFTPASPASYLNLSDAESSEGIPGMKLARMHAEHYIAGGAETPELIGTKLISGGGIQSTTEGGGLGAIKPRRSSDLLTRGFQQQQATTHRQNSGDSSRRLLRAGSGSLTGVGATPLSTAYSGLSTDGEGAGSQYYGLKIPGGDGAGDGNSDSELYTDNDSAVEDAIQQQFLDSGGSTSSKANTGEQFKQFENMFLANVQNELDQLEQ